MNGKLMLAVLLLALVLAPLGHTPPANAAAGPRFSLSSDSAATPVGGMKTIGIEVDGASDLVAYELRLEFDPKRWAFSSATCDLAGYKATPLPERQADGIVTFVFAKIGRAAGENGTVHLARVTLKAKAAGGGRIRLTGVRLVDSGYAAADYTPDTALVAVINRSGGGKNRDFAADERGRDTRRAMRSLRGTD